MTFWFVAAALCLAAVLFAVWPIWKSARRLTPMLAGVVVFTVGTAAALYGHLGDPELPSGRSGEASLPDMDAVMASLRARLEANPEDANGWKMLGRSSLQLRQYGEAVAAFETAMELEDGRDAQTHVDLALALLSRDQTRIEGRPAALIESALAIDPNNPSALFYSGTAAAERGNTELAASRWEVLLGLNPPPEIRGLLEQRIAQWRGEPLPAAGPGVGERAAPGIDASQPDADPDAVVTARVALSENAMRSIKADANVFLIARDPVQPSPPIAVSRLRVSELPSVVSLGDAQSMVEGRSLSGFEEFELLARVSLSGGPAAAPGDWFGTLVVRPAENNSVFLSIDQQVQ